MRDLNKSYKKIDRLRWHKEKAFIRMVCAFSCAILLIILLLMFPILSDADEPKISDYYFINDILKLSDAQSHNNENGFYSVPDNIFNSPTFISDDSINYYDQLKNLWDCDFPSGLGNNYNMTVYVSTNNQIKVIFEGQSISLNYDSNYNYLTPPSIYGGSPVVYTFNNNSLVYDSYLDGGSYKNISDCNYILYTTMSINMYYQNADRNLNYLLIENKVGKGQGGFNVVSPNTDIKDHMQLYEKSSMYLVPSTMNSGNFYIYPNIDDFQEQRKLDYSLILNVSCNYNVSYNNGGSYVVKYNNTSVRNYYNITASASNWGGSHDFVFPLNDAIGGTSISLNSINDSLITSSGNSITALAGGLSESATNDGFMKPILQAIGGTTVAGVQVDISNILNQGWDILLNGCDYHFELYLKNNSTNVISSNPCLVYDYNFITGSGSINYDNLSDNEKVKQANDSEIVPPEYNYNNDEPNYPDTYNPNNNNEPSNNNNSPNNNNNVTNGDYSPSVVNNNNISVVPNNSSLPDKGVMNKFVRIINNDKNNTVNDLNELVGGNAYIQLINNALYAVPQNVWNVWITALKAILGICVSAFFLKILINWST